jgi:hypothetical protein
VKYIILAAALLIGGALVAHADTDIWNGKSSTADMNTAFGACTEQFGEEPRGIPPTPEFKQCMRKLGWRYVATRHDDTWMRGSMTCHHILNGIGSECSSF